MTCIIDEVMDGNAGFENGLSRLAVPLTMIADSVRNAGVEDGLI